MRHRFDDKTVVVSGAAHGFGRCIAETFAQLGTRFGCDLCAAELAETAKAGVNTEVLDLTDRAAAAAWIAPIEQVPDTDWDRVLRGQHRCRLRVEPCNGGGVKRAGSGRNDNIRSGAGLGPSLTGIRADR